MQLSQAPPALATTKEAAAELGVSESRIRQLCIAGRIVGAYKQGRDWVMPRPVRRVEQ